jgi:quercetin dioxygenase-like cupin family protein
MKDFRTREKTMAKTATTSRLIKESEYDPNNSLAKKSGWPKQTFHISHLREEDFTNEGFRAYTLVRDLGFAKATGGMVQAHVNRRARPFNAAEVSKPHFHDTLFQMVYILKGWVRSEFEGHGIIEMREGSSWIQPPGMKHCVRDYSDDLELLEIILPAEYDTVNIAGPVTEKS